VYFGKPQADEIQMRIPPKPKKSKLIFPPALATAPRGHLKTEAYNPVAAVLTPH